MSVFAILIGVLGYLALLLMWAAGIGLAAYVITWAWMTLFKKLCPPAWRRKEPWPGAGFGFALAWLVTAIMLPWLWGLGVSLVDAYRAVPPQWSVVALVSHDRPVAGRCSITVFRLSDATLADVQQRGAPFDGVVIQGRWGWKSNLRSWGRVNTRYVDNNELTGKSPCFGYGSNALRDAATGVDHTSGLYAEDGSYQWVLLPIAGLLMVGQRVSD